jgi:hypothetical protein
MDTIKENQLRKLKSFILNKRPSLKWSNAYINQELPGACIPMDMRHDFLLKDMDGIIPLSESMPSTGTGVYFSTMIFLYNAEKNIMHRTNKSGHEILDIWENVL